MRIETMILLGSVIVFIASIWNWFRYDRKHKELSGLLIENIEQQLDVRRTIATGLYYRFKNGKDSYTDMTFEEFVVDLFEKTYGGELFYTSIAEGFGVDFEDRREDGRYFIQLKCSQEDVSFHDVALLHSAVVKWDSAGGYIATTASFTKEAVEYGEGLGITLINGIDLADMWLKALQEQEEYMIEGRPIRT
ncbi:restriction endonuclease [Halalkalibacter urbisdiaboli]|uniref:restriction endonuclease n=1 Tax=Halalkalibacter urbisdiaboli TaxID=1960589 RepID=UPI000B4481EF|nr:restriction endonuclease [Halalkalibacter urbisdiaboli]